MKKLAVVSLLGAVLGAGALNVAGCGRAPLAEPDALLGDPYTAAVDPAQPDDGDSGVAAVPEPDAGSPTPEDGGAPEDGGGPPPADAGAPADAGSRPDAGVTPPDAGVDAGRPLAACAATFAGCATFTDLTAVNAQIAFSGAIAGGYEPRCITVKVAQAVQFRGQMGTKFADFPLEQACGTPTVIPRTDGNDLEARFAFPVAGKYGFHNPERADAGVSGVIQVVP